MNLTVTLPNTDLSMVDWFIKHNISSNICSVGISIVRAVDSQVEL